jgi:probable rRNA maturation factor
VTLTLSGDDELAELDRRHMGVDGPTDVLSFPLLLPTAFPRHAGQSPAPQDDAEDAFPTGPGAPILLGDIIVSVERAVAQASAGQGGQTSDVSWSPQQELRLLITHGALHLCGWDHAEPVERDAMRALEVKLLGLEVPR